MPLLNFKDKFTKEKSVVGLDIGTQTVKIVKLKLSKDTAELSGYHLEPTQIDLEQVIRNASKTQDATRVNVSFSGPASIIRYANFMKMANHELGQALKFEAQKHIPFSINEVYLDGYILKEDLSDNKMLVLLAAVKKEFMNQRLKILEGSGLKVTTADIDSLALINAFNFNYGKDEKLKDTAVALLNIGATQSNLSILENAIPRFSRDIPVAGNHLTQKIADLLNVDFKAAEEFKLNQDKEKLGKAASGVESVISNLAGEVRISFDYFESQSASSVDRMYLSGGASLYMGLKEILAGLLGVEVEYWNPFKQIKIPDGIDTLKLEKHAAQLAVCLGLALRS